MSLTFWSNVSLCLTTILTNLLIFRFYAEVYQIKIKTKYMLVILFVISTALYLFVNRTVSHYNLPSFLNSVYTIVHINIWSFISCQEKLKRKLLLNMVCFLIMLATEVFSATIWTVIENISLQNVLTRDKYIIFGCALNTLLMFLVFNIFIYVLSRKELTKFKTTQIILLLLLTVFEIFVVYTYTFKINSYLDGIIAIIMLVGFLAFDFAITYIIEMTADFYEDKMELQLIRTQAEQYNGMFFTEYDEKVFKARLMIPANNQ